MRRREWAIGTVVVPAAGALVAAGAIAATGCAAGARRPAAIDVRDGRVVGVADGDDVAAVRVVSDGYVVTIGGLRTTLFGVS